MPVQGAKHGYPNLLVSLTSPLVESNEDLFKQLIDGYKKEHKSNFTDDIGKNDADLIDECVDSIGIMARRHACNLKFQSIRFY